MEQISFKLPVFEGPLDLLLHLISKHKLDIYDIEITKLLEQYLLYMEQCTEQNYELAGEFLEMAAKLVYIKTVSLLPSPEEAEEIKKELEGALIEYSLCKLAAATLAERNLGDAVFVRKPMKLPVDLRYCRTHAPEVLVEAYQKIGKAAVNPAPIAQKINAVVKKKMVSVLSKVVFILRRLYTTGIVQMDRLYDGMTDRSARVATFLAVLELTRSGRIRLSDDNTQLLFTRKNKKCRYHNAHGYQRENG